MPKDTENLIRDELKSIRLDCRLGAEMKWGKISHKMLAPYFRFVQAFFNHYAITFKCIVIDTHILDYKKYSNGDKELGFYKFYFNLISRNICVPTNSYWLYTDELNTRKPTRLDTLQIVTNRWCKKNRNCEPLKKVEPRNSAKEDLIQMADLLLGAVGHDWNCSSINKSKALFAKYVASNLGRNDLHFRSTPSERKLNIWCWQPRKR